MRAPLKLMRTDHQQDFLKSPMGVGKIVHGRDVLPKHGTAVLQTLTNVTMYQEWNILAGMWETVTPR